jgi:hypothetical protein
MPLRDNGLHEPIARGDADTEGLFRALGTPLDWPEAKKNADHVRQWGVKVLLSPAKWQHYAESGVIATSSYMESG